MSPLYAVLYIYIIRVRFFLILRKIAHFYIYRKIKPNTLLLNYLGIFPLRNMIPFRRYYRAKLTILVGLCQIPQKHNWQRMENCTGLAKVLLRKLLGVQIKMVLSIFV